jgi:protein-glutamine gamma-glutamyltransferase
MTVMLRSLGIPARYVNGFQTGEYNDVGGDYIVRESDAHSWVEVYFPGFGWITFDPTPPGNAESHGMFSRLGMYWDWFQFAWGEWVINYDFSHQVTLTQNLQRASRHWTDQLRRYADRRREQAIDTLLRADNRVRESPHVLSAMLIILVIAFLLLRSRAIAGYLIMRWHLRLQRGGALTPALAVLEYRQMLKLLERRGWRKTDGQTPAEFAASIPATEFAGPVSQLTELYQSARFGAHPADAQAMTALLNSIRSLIHSQKKSG